MQKPKSNPALLRPKTETTVVEFRWIDWGWDEYHTTRFVRIRFHNLAVIVEPLTTFTGPPRALLRVFGSAGQVVTKMEQLADVMAEIHRAVNNDPPAFILCRLFGWNRDQRVYIGTKIYGQPSQEIVRSFDHVNQRKFISQGTKEEWDEIALLSHHNSRFMFGILCALAGPVLDILGLPSIAFQLVGPPNIGKTTILRVAGSVWGADLIAPHRSFFEILPNSMTELQQLVLAHNDSFLPLDETPTLASGKRLVELIGKMAIRLPEAFGRASLLIATNTALPDRLGAMFDGSYRSRLPSIPADAGHGFGAFECLHGYPDASTLARRLELLTSQFCGTAIDAFLESLTRDRRRRPVELRNFLNNQCADYCRAQGRGSASPVDGSIIEKFGHFYAVGVIAVHYGILKWSIDDVRWAVRECERSHHEAMASTTGDIDPVAVIRDYLAQNIHRLLKVPNPEITREQFESAPAVWQLDRNKKI